MRVFPRLLTSALLLAGCGSGAPESGTADPAAMPVTLSGNAVDTTVATTFDRTAASGARPPPQSSADRARDTELLNPEGSTMVFLYHDLAGIAPPLDRWVEADRRMQIAQPADKAALRAAIRAELEAAAAAVRGAGFIRLSLNADLSDYDPTYGEFTVRALAPSSVVPFDAFGQKVSLKFANGRTAQLWRVSPEEAQAVRDKLGFNRSVTLDVLLKIGSVQPGPGGGTIVADVLEYEMRQTYGASTLARVQVPSQ